ncbi:MAG: NAD(P)H-hydrate dehydratase [Bacteroidia bacterium]|nr:NAD(P)H-hydrate dehydratase [Bacteroidia bacterium]
MKILSNAQARQADIYTIQHEPISSIDLMERAAGSCCRWIESKFEKDQKFKIFCGQGNNGGDGLAIARMLLQSGFSVKVFILKHGKNSSVDFLVNQERLHSLDPAIIYEISSASEIPEMDESDCVIDALFGSGLNKPISGIIATCIRRINDSGAYILSVDIPSGLFADQPSDSKAAIIQASVTLTFQFPKLSFLFPSTGRYTGKWVLMDIRLHPQFLRDQETKWNYFTLKDAKFLLPARPKFSHKGNFGHAMIISGSKGKMGAAVLASKACARSGCGLLTMHVPGCGQVILQTTSPEAMLLIDENENLVSSLPDYSNYTSVAIGPGIGTNALTWETLRHLLYTYRKPIVLDADALNLLAQHPDWLEYIPENSILTPHIKEFARLTKEAKDDFERFELQIQFAKKYKVIVVLKGAHTCIVDQDGNAWFNSTGNPGMAKGGSGDVLSGILVSLLAQGYPSLEAAQLGVFIHGLAGDEAAGIKTEISMLPSDLIKCLPLAFRKLKT